MVRFYVQDSNARSVYAIDETRGYCAFATDAREDACGSDEIYLIDGKRIDSGSEPLDAVALFACERERFTATDAVDSDLREAIGRAFKRALS